MDDGESAESPTRRRGLTIRRRPFLGAVTAATGAVAGCSSLAGDRPHEPLFRLGRGVRSWLTVDGDYAYFTDTDGHAVAVDVTTGERTWSTRIGESPPVTPAPLEDGAVVGEDRLYSLSASGEITWETELVDRFNAQCRQPVPSLVDESGVMLGLSDGHLYRFSRSDGAVEWATAIGPRECIGWSRADDLVAVTTAGRSLALVDTRTGEVVERAGFPTAVTPHLTTDGLYLGGPVVRGLARDLTERWRVETGSTLPYRPAVHERTVYAVATGESDGTVYAIDRETGEVRWQRSLDDGVSGPPTVDATGTVYVGTLASGSVHGFSPDGERVRSLALDESGVAGPPRVMDERLVALTRHGDLYSVPL